MKTCPCRICVYSKVISGLVARQATQKDKKLVEELYSNMMHAEDDADYWKIKVHGGFEKLTEEVRKNIEIFESRERRCLKN